MLLIAACPTSVGCAPGMIPLPWRASLSMSALAKGVHGQGSRFMPLVALHNNEYAPTLLPIAGMLSQCSVEEYLAPVTPALPEMGQWNYYMLDQSNAPTGFVAIETTEPLRGAESPVVLVAYSAELGIPMTEGANAEVLVVVERAEPCIDDPEAFDPRQFYVFSREDGGLEVGWRADYPADGTRVVGRVLYTYLPYVAPSKKPGGGFAELDDDFTF